MRLIAYLHGICSDSDGSYVNIPVDRIERDDTFLSAYKDGRLVALFDNGTVLVAYLSEQKSGRKKEDGNAEI